MTTTTRELWQNIMHYGGFDKLVLEKDRQAIDNELTGWVLSGKAGISWNPII